MLYFGKCKKLSAYTQCPVLVTMNVWTVNTIAFKREVGKIRSVAYFCITEMKVSCSEMSKIDSVIFLINRQT